jgi:3',5'-cyclic AMP phosphodiesterase CpdA
MRVAHFSDLHLLSLAGARALDFANKRWIGGLNLLANRGRHYHTGVFEALIADLNRLDIDHAICTGDVTNLAMEQEFHFARELFDRIRLGPRDVTVIPGNHDAYIARGAAYFTGYFAAYHACDPGWEWPDGDAWPVVRVRGDVAIIGVSTSLATPWFTAYGEVGPTQLERLRRVLADARLADRCRIVAIHHPPAGRWARSRIRGLHDRKAFAAVLAEAGAELVLHGYEHRNLHNTLPGPGGTAIPVNGINSGTYEAGDAERLAAYRIYAVGPANSRPAPRGADMRIYVPDSGQFAPDSGRS